MDRQYVLSMANTKITKKGRKSVAKNNPRIILSLQLHGDSNTKDKKETYQIQVWLRDDVNRFSKIERWDVAYLKDAKRLYIFYDSNNPASGYKVKALKNGYHTITFTNNDFAKNVFDNCRTVISPDLQYDEEANMYYVQFKEDKNEKI